MRRRRIDAFIAYTVDNWTHWAMAVHVHNNNNNKRILYKKMQAATWPPYLFMHQSSSAIASSVKTQTHTHTQWNILSAHTKTAHCKRLNQPTTVVYFFSFVFPSSVFFFFFVRLFARFLFFRSFSCLLACPPFLSTSWNAVHTAHSYKLGSIYIHT